MKKGNFKKTAAFLLSLMMILSLIPATASVRAADSNQTALQTQAGTEDHSKQVIGYITQWDAWKTTSAGLPAQGALTHLNIDYSQYTILNYSFFGVANDGSLHSGDFRNKDIYKPGTQQQPAPLLYTDVYSSWDLHILFGELEPVYYVNEDVMRRAKEQGFELTETGSTWSNPGWGVYNQQFPLPLKKEGGAPGLFELAKRNGVKVNASIGGWSMCRHYSDVAADPAKRAKFVQECVRLIDLGFDGIDLDWEYPGPYDGMNFTGKQEDYDNFVTLVKEIRQAIGNDKLITSCFSADTRKLEGFNWTEINKYVDYYNFMTYDFNGGWSDKAGHNSPLYGYSDAEAPDFNWDHLYQYLVKNNIDLSKSNMGIAFYGRGVITDGPAALNAPTVKREEFVQPDGNITTCADYTNWPKDVFDGTPYYYYIKDTALAPNSGWERHWDDEAKVPYLTKGNYFLSYDDETSVGCKAQYIKDKNLGGVIVWTAYEDLELGGTVTNYGTKLKQWSDVKSPLIHKVNEVFADGTTKAAAPAFTPAGGTYYESQDVTISCDTEGAVIHYTLDGSQPTASSPIYNGAIKITETTTVKARAYKEGMSESSIVSAVYTIRPTPSGTVATPVISPEGGEYDAAQSVTITCATEGAQIRYTLDETEPTESSALYSGPITLKASAVLNAKAFKDGMWESEKATAAYTIEIKIPAWQPNVTYEKGAVVSYDNKNYECMLGHTSLTGWEPAATPALWKVVSE